MNLPLPESAFAAARVRFLAGLRAKAAETSRVVESYLAEPDAERFRESLRRHLHALSASARLFGLEKLGEHINLHIALLDTQNGNSVDAYRWRSLPVRYLDLVRDAHAQPEELQSGTFNNVASAEVSNAESVPDAKGAEIRTEDESSFSSSSLHSDARELGTYRTEDLSLDAELESVITVLIVDEPEASEQIKDALSDPRYEVVEAESPDEGLRMVRQLRPDVVFVHESVFSGEGPTAWQMLAADVDVARTPTIWLFDANAVFDADRARKAGAVAALQKPLHATSVERVVRRVTQSASSSEAARVLGELTLRELADRIADEIKRGVVRDAQGDSGEAISFGDGAEILAPIWSAIAQVRQSVSERTLGAIRYGATSTGRSSHLLSLTHQGEDVATPLQSNALALENRTAVIADDDPAVVWFFAGVLREVGMQVFEAYDGTQAFDAAMRYRPDVIIADILMPRLDGLSLCAALEKEPLLSDVPVILTSWRDDFLERVRELQSGAQGYLRKEAGAHDVIARIEEVLAPRLRLEERLRQEGEVRGRTDGIALVHFLESVKQHMPNARVLLRDAWSLFELHVAQGRIVEINRTAADGSFVRNERAVIELLGVRSARFTAMRSEWQRPPALERDFEKELDMAARRLSAINRALSAPALGEVASIEFESDAIASYCQTSPEPVRVLIRQIAEGMSPAELLARDPEQTRLLERVLLNAAKRGAVRSVVHRDGTDLIAHGQAERLKSAQPPATELSKRVEDLIEQGLAPSPVNMKSWRPAEAPAADEANDQPIVRESLRSASTVAMVNHATNPLPVDLFDNVRDSELTQSDYPQRFADLSPPRERMRMSWSTLLLLALLLLASASLWAVSRTVPISLESPTRGAQAAHSKWSSAGTELPVSRTEDLFPSERIDQVLAVGVPVHAGEGLLVIESANPRVPMQLQVDGKAMGSPPYAGALPEGVYEVEIRRGTESEFRYYRVDAASTRVVSLH